MRVDELYTPFRTNGAGRAACATRHWLLVCETKKKKRASRNSSSNPSPSSAPTPAPTFNISRKTHCVVLSSRVALLVFIRSCSEPPSKYSIEIHKELARHKSKREQIGGAHTKKNTIKKRAERFLQNTASPVGGGGGASPPPLLGKHAFSRSTVVVLRTIQQTRKA